MTTYMHSGSVIALLELILCSTNSLNKYQHKLGLIITQPYLYNTNLKCLFWCSKHPFYKNICFLLQIGIPLPATVVIWRHGINRIKLNFVTNCCIHFITRCASTEIITAIGIVFVMKQHTKFF